MKKLIVLFVMILLVPSCSDNYFETDNNRYIDEENLAELYRNDPEKAEASVLSIYDRLFFFGGGSSFGHDEISMGTYMLGTDLMGEDMVQHVHHWYGFYYNFDNRMYNYRSVDHFWREWLFPMVNQSNSLLKILNNIHDNQQIEYLRGETYALRAFAYLYLARIFQKAYSVDSSLPGVPLSTENTSETMPGRNTLQDVYNRIILDLETAYSLLNGYNRSSKHRVNKQVVAGFLARAYMDMENWQEVAFYANEARQGFTLMNESEYQSGFSSLAIPEVMWGSDISSDNTNDIVSFFSHISSTDPGGYVEYANIYKKMDKRLYDQIPTNDFRKIIFQGESIGLPSQSNLKFRTELADFSGDLIYMRASEMYLMEAEAQYHLNNLTQAQSVLSSLVNSRLTSGSYTPSSNLLDDIILQRRVELWGEGFSNNDRKRWDMGIDRNYSGTNHRSDSRFVIPSQDFRWVFQIPLAEMQTNPNITEADQNP